MVAVKDRRNAFKNPYAHLQDRGHLHRVGQGVADDVGSGALPRVVPLLGRGLRRGLHRPEGWRRRRRRRPAAGLGPRHRGPLRAGQLPRSGPGPTPGRRGLLGRPLPPGWASPIRSGRSTAPSSTCRSAGTSRCGWRATTSPRPVRVGGWSRRGDTELGGSFPVNMSGGVLSSNPIGASGLLRFAEAANRSGAWPASTRSTGPRWPWPRPTGRPPSTSACGSWAVPSTPWGDRGGRAHPTGWFRGTVGLAPMPNEYAAWGPGGRHVD